MVTYAQLEAEVWWRQEIVTDELDWLVGKLCAHFGVPRSNGGTRGNNVHLNGGHRSQAWIKHSRYCTNRSYATEAGLTAEQERDIAAFDITLPAQHMLTISRNADRATRAGQLEELVEWFGNVNGDQRVDGWDNIRNQVASSDSSHLWHLHGRIARRLLRDMNTMRRIFAALTGQPAQSAPLKGIFMAGLTDEQQADLYRRVKNIDKILWYGFKGGEVASAEELTAGTGAAPVPVPGPVPLALVQFIKDIHENTGGGVMNPTAQVAELDYDLLADKVADKLAARLQS